ncbi:Alpha/beta hydrolase fold-3 [Dillenia turbinata]|uniref:Alpha/beta hydrolase fold-3 n=1 Tax=Dillenia turbinata TaxID=194707 RepID=A0AAN8UT26_9MAGN
MDPSPEDIALELLPFVRVYKNGHIERLKGTEIVPPGLDPKTGIQSKDIEILPEFSLSARLYIPKITNPSQKFPLLIYFHGGGFIIESPFSPVYHNYLNSLVLEANVVAVSVEYRRAPEHVLPIAYDDSWAAVKWVESNFLNGGEEDWIKKYADCNKVFFAGDSAGGNITYHMAMRVGSGQLPGMKLSGVVLAQPFFWGKDPIGCEREDPHTKEYVDGLWNFSYPGLADGCDDPAVNPEKDPNLGSFGCKNVLVCVAGKDIIRDRGWWFSEILKKSGWVGNVDVMEAEGEDHVFHLFNPSCENAKDMLKRVSDFMNQEGKD